MVSLSVFDTGFARPACPADDRAKTQPLGRKDSEEAGCRLMIYFGHQSEVQMADSLSGERQDEETSRKPNILVEVWEEDRPLNKVILSDVIRCFIVCFGITLSSLSLHLAPGLAEDTKRTIELVHNTILASSLIVFSLLLFTEMMIIRVRRLRAVLAAKP